jgi:hypothetical protein
LVSVAIGLGVVASSASAAIRYAAPGADGSAPCVQADPCSFFIAASGDAPNGQRVAEGDEVVLLPGNYTGSAGDLGPQEVVSLVTGITLRGAHGGPARIESNARGGILDLNGWDTVSDLEIVAPLSTRPFVIIESTAERVIVRDWGDEGIACVLSFKAVILDSVCIAHGSHGVGAGNRSGSNAPFDPRTLRNVTAIADGAGSTGLLFVAEDGGEVIATVKSSIARGTSEDVEAIGVGTGSAAAVLIEHSDFTTTNEVPKNGGIGFVTEPEINGNITEAPVLAADGYHELPDSPTVDEGVVDGSSGSLDIDGQLRTIGIAPDIGADELADTTSLDFACSQAAVISSARATCPVTVTDTSPGGAVPTGIVDLSAAEGSFGRTCVLTALSAVAAGCDAEYVPGSAPPGFYGLRASYAGDGTHDRSEGEVTITVEQGASSNPGNGGSTITKAAPATIAAVKCKVPKLIAATLRTAKKKLRTARCKLGEVKKSNGVTARSAKVKKQGPKPNTILGAGAKVNVTLGERDQAGREI